MRMAAIFGLNQVVSHGFGVFLFAALLPLMRESINISNWQLAAIGALTPLSYLAGALLLGLIGHRVGTVRLALTTTSLTTALLFLMSQLRDPLHITLALIILAASASISWGTIVEIISRYASCMSCASSGTAWGYGANGLLILLVVPLFGWESSWIIAGVIGVLALMLSWRLLRGLQPRVLNADSSTDTAAIPAMRLLGVILGERTALFACIICFLVGFSAMPLSAWLNIYLAGYLREATGSLNLVYDILTVTALLLVALGLFIRHTGKGTVFTVDTIPQLPGTI
ncbi:MFS transporter [Marinobacterium sedimentorum]|uniref:MFS transporter n=1 Tax=Marinobacterium sedimentorum TaxID=2927804 RepID=UPI0020C5E45B|nr:MFS transporter [Marinobacterium sedimentorum]MCP8689007.1 MFS transporter [Marinobacterium sedimentorum]